MMILILGKGLYGFKSSGAMFWNWSDTFRRMNFLPSKADPDFWFKDCSTPYEYIARYVDDILIFSKELQELVKCLQVK